MKNVRNKFSLEGLFLLGALVLLMITVSGIPTFAQRGNLATGRVTSANVVSVFDPFLLQRITFTPVVAPASNIRLAGTPRVNAYVGNRGSNNGKPPVLVPGRRAVRSQWMPGDGPPPHVFPNPPGL